MKLSPKKGGHGYVTSYTINIGSAEARKLGFVNSNGELQELEKIIDESNQSIIIRKEKQESE